MSKLSPETREAARRRKILDRNLRDVAGIAAVVTTPVPLAAAAFALIAVAGARLADSASDIENDPPRGDYDVETLVEEPAVFWWTGDSALDQAASDLLQAALATVAYEEAMVTADERALGARLADDETNREAREREAEAFGEQAADHNLSVARHADALAELLDTIAGNWGPGAAVAASLRDAGRASEEYGVQYRRHHGGAIA